MKNFLKLRRLVTSGSVARTGLQLVGVKLITALFVLVLLVVAIAVTPQLGSQAQRLYLPTKVLNVSAQGSAGGTVVSIGADGPLSRAQSWQDNEGFHVILPNTVLGDSLRTPRGVKVRRIGTSLEILLQTKPEAKVALESAENQLNLAVDGELESRSVESEFRESSAEERRLFEDQRYSNQGRQENLPLKFSSAIEDLTPNSHPAPTEDSHPASSSNSKVSNAATQQINTNQIVPQGDGSRAPAVPASEIKVQPEDDGLLASVFSGTSVLVVVVLGFFGLLVSRKLRSRQAVAQSEKTSTESSVRDNDERADGIGQGRSEQIPDANSSLVRGRERAPTIGSSRQPVVRLPVAGPTSLYGAYRIDQEVGKLILGQPHRMDVLGSRAVDDRRAIETSLIKGVNAPDLEEIAHQRARGALEEYGFVARQCAILLLAPDAFERTSAARTLGEIKSPTALPFLLEGLYDSESIVRNQSVVSIGELKLPSAIGALLDIARTHPDVPSALLSRTLSACSVEGLDFFDAVVAEPLSLESGHAGNIIEEITHLAPASSVEELPEGTADEQLSSALALLESTDLDERSEALKTLAQFPVQSSVGAIGLVARHDSEPAIRALAIASLGAINHESVFPVVLIGMADETREVRAAAARSLNRLSFDRADAYVRVIETGDEETIRDVARACVQAGIVSQNVDRLANSDHRQAYETFSLICLLGKAQMNEPILDVIANHPNVDVRLKAVHLLACTGQPEVFEQLRELAVRDGMGEEVKTALLEALYKLDQAKPQVDDTLEAFVATREGSELQLETAQVETASTDFGPALEAEVQPNEDEFELWCRDIPTPEL